MSSLSVQAIKTRIFCTGEDLASFLLEYVTATSLEGKILAITSKIVSLAENRLVNKSSISRMDLIRREADHIFAESEWVYALTLKHGILIPSAGIDESNSEGDFYILYPEDPYQSTRRIHEALREKLGIENFGVLMTDSHTTPLRRGVTGIALAYWGFRPTKSCVGIPDLFGRALRVTHQNIADGLAAAAVLNMGEANESSPLALCAWSKAEFENESHPEELRIDPLEDIYEPLLRRR